MDFCQVKNYDSGMPIEKCRRCVENQSCESPIANECLPIPVFGDIEQSRILVATVGLNPALNEFYQKGELKSESQRLAVLGDYAVTSRLELSDESIADAKTRRNNYFRNPVREWHQYFEKFDSLLARTNPAWSYWQGTAVHIDIVACATKVRWGDLTARSKAVLIGNCREYLLESLSRLPDGTVVLCDGGQVMQEIANCGMRLDMKPVQLINLRTKPTGDAGWIGTLEDAGKRFKVRGWSAYVTHLNAHWRFDLSHWLRGTLK